MNSPPGLLARARTIRDRTRFLRRPAAVSRELSVRMREQDAAARFGLFARLGRQLARKRGGKGRVILRTAGRELVPEVMDNGR